MSTPTPTTPPTATPEPLDQHLRRIVARLDAGRREAFEERAAIVEYDAGLPREEAERRALLDVLANLGFPMPVQLLQMEIAGGTQWVLTGDGPASGPASRCRPRRVGIVPSVTTSNLVRAFCGRASPKDLTTGGRLSGHVTA